jgi:predicted transcriptional regulator
MAKSRTVRISEEAYARLEQMAQVDRRSVSNMAEVVILEAPQPWPGITLLDPEGLAEEGFGELQRGTHESDDEYAQRAELIKNVLAVARRIPARK